MNQGRGDHTTVSGGGETSGTRSACHRQNDQKWLGAVCSYACATSVLFSGLSSGLRDSAAMRIPRELNAVCPNAARHSKSSVHESTLVQFHDSLRQQLVRSHAHAIEYLGLHDSSGHMFTITLCSHGYPIIGNGSRADQVPTLSYELSIYKSVHPLQGQIIPICLGLL